MSPYFWFGLAMLGVVVISLLVTGNLAAMFNERAKRDLKEALEGLAPLIDGSVSIEDARVAGRYQGQITTGQVVAGPGGMGRLFQTTFIEPAGGREWTAVVRRPKTESEAWERSFSGPDGLAEPIYGLLDDLLRYPGWFEMKYLPDAGELRLTRAMQSRRDLPSGERFSRYVDTLELAAGFNRSVQAPVGAG